MNYEVKLLPSAQKDLDALETSIFKRVHKKLEELTNDPRPHGCLKLTAEEGYRIRVGDWRILYRVEDSSKTLFIYRIKHRREAYR